MFDREQPEERVVEQMLEGAKQRFNEKNYEEAFRLYSLAADIGSAQAQYDLGCMHENGQGTKKNNAEAVRLYGLAADQGLADAQNDLGNMYRLGLGVSKSYKEAVRLYRLAAAQGYIDAQYNLASLYEDGLGVRKNTEEAMRLYRLAANKGDIESQQSLDRMYKDIQRVELDHYKNKQKLIHEDAPISAAETILPASKEQKLSVIEIAKPIQVDLEEKSAEKLRKRAKQHFDDEDYVEAFRLYYLAAAEGSALAQNDLACLYVSGHGVCKHHEEAARLYRLAAGKGVADAQDSLDRMYKEGLGVEQDYNKKEQKLISEDAPISLVKAISPTSKEQKLSAIEFAKQAEEKYEKNRQELMEQLLILKAYYNSKVGDKTGHVGLCGVLHGLLKREDYSRSFESVFKEYRIEDVFYSRCLKLFFAKKKNKLGILCEDKLLTFIKNNDENERQVKEKIKNEISETHDKNERAFLVKKMIAALPEKYRMLPNETLIDILVKEETIEEEQRKVDQLLAPTPKLSSAKDVIMFKPTTVQVKQDVATEPSKPIHNKRTVILS